MILILPCRQISVTGTIPEPPHRTSIQASSPCLRPGLLSLSSSRPPLPCLRPGLLSLPSSRPPLPAFIQASSFTCTLFLAPSPTGHSHLPVGEPPRDSEQVMGPRTGDTSCKSGMMVSRVEGGRQRTRSDCSHCRQAPALRSSCPVLYNPKSVLKRPVSPEELQKPGSPYTKRTFTIVGDAVGWGFVVRGNGPCHIQAVDPSGPAAAAGMKVCQFVVAVNSVNVLSLDYKTVSNFILTGPRTVVMEIMEEADC